MDYSIIVSVFLSLLWRDFMTAGGPDDDDELAVEYYDDLYCPACDKSFKSDKA
jgi:hypothetical protein